ncbi:MAG TPA: hypothetical protein VNI58_03790 [Mariprofundaceae bacterium]|nr:hypothetical protein [Mariprofundaceae bacterium]
MRLRLVATLLVAITTLSGCASIGPTGGIMQQPLIGPYPAFSGRLLVIEPARRWQVGIDWQAEAPEAGKLRLTHAASGMVVELAWDHGEMRIRDSQHPEFRPVALTELQQHGIVVAPWTLAAILLGDMPATFHPTRPGEWEGHQGGALIRIVWDAGQRRLTLTDITHGRRATLLIGT